jgi:glutamate dehydrogenase/leucine dehydrogenase
MAEIFTKTRFVTCIPPELGGSGNPSHATAIGVICAMEGALDHLGLGSLAGKTVAMQGLGNVASFMLEELLVRGVRRIAACDISKAAVARAQRFASDRVEVRLVSPQDTSIFSEPCDVFAPNALGGVLTAETIERLACRIVCGAANNQLFDDRLDDKRLAAKNVVYVPDFVANRMGIVNCANEQYGNLEPDPAVTRHFGRDWENAVYVVTRRILERAQAGGMTSTSAANELADELSSELHPIWPHRGAHIIQSLIASKWQDGG